MNLTREPPWRDTPRDRIPRPVTMKEMDLVQGVSFGNLSRCFRKTKRVDRGHRRRISPIPEDVKLVWRIFCSGAFCVCYQGIDLLNFGLNRCSFDCQSWTVGGKFIGQKLSHESNQHSLLGFRQKSRGG